MTALWPIQHCIRKTYFENYFTTKIQRMAEVPVEAPFLYLSEMGLFMIGIVKRYH